MCIRDRVFLNKEYGINEIKRDKHLEKELLNICLLYTSDAADDTPCVDLGGRGIIKK